MKYRADIDGLRAIAVLFVVIYHAIPAALPGGFIGVDVFFVISGYLITRIITEEIGAEQFSFVQFYQRRVMRLAPAFIVVAICTTAMAYYLYAPTDLEKYGKSLLATILIHANHYFLANTGYFQASDEVTPLLHMWSLSVEEQFYVVFPLFLFLLKRSQRSLRRWIAVVGVISFAAGCMAINSFQEQVFFLLPFRAWELMAGSLLAVTHFPAQPKLAVPGAALIIAPLILLDTNSTFPAWNALMPCVGAALLIRSQGSWVSTFLSCRPVNYVGRTSYSFYLWHWPVIAFAKYILNREMSVFEGVVAIVFSFALSVITYHYVELPFRRRIQIKTIACVASSLTGLLLLGLYIDKAEGLSDRLPPHLKAFADIMEKRSGPPSDQCRVDEMIRADNRLAPLEGFSEARICKIGDQGSVAKIIIWGDSHANAMAPALDLWLSQRKMSAYSITRGGCAPFIGLERRDSTSWHCRAFQDAAKLTIANIQPSTLFITARWPYYFEAAGFGSDRDKAPLFGQEPRQNADLVYESLSDTLAWSKRNTSRLVVVGPTPEIGENVFSGLVRRYFQNLPQEVSVSRSVVEKRVSRSVSQLKNLSSLHGAEYVDVIPLYCTENSCRGGDQKDLVFIDESHISPQAAGRMEQVLSRFIE